MCRCSASEKNDEQAASHTSTDAALTTLALDAAIAAARVIVDIYNRPFTTTFKSDGSPVTQADAAAEAVILDILRPSHIPVLGEESVAAGSVPQLGDCYFVVDPLDGTKEFIKRNGEFTVNIALIEHGVPVMGVILAPATGNTYIGDASGAWMGRTLDGTLHCKYSISVADLPRRRIVASRSHNRKILNSLYEAFNIEADISVGSSLKFGLLAAGQAQLYPRFTPTAHWDTAAGQAVLEAAGGAIVTLDGARLHYDQANANFLNPYFAAASSLDLAQRIGRKMIYILNHQQNMC